MKATRMIVAAHAVWIVMSRPYLPRLFEWPDEFWAGSLANAPIRYVWLFTPGIERILYGLLFVTLLLALAGVGTRWSCLVSAVLLYHFAPLENAFIAAPGPYDRGLT